MEELCTKQMNGGEIEVCNNNKRLLKEIEKYPAKESDCTQEANAAVEGMHRQIDKAKVNIILKHTSNKPR